MAVGLVFELLFVLYFAFAHCALFCLFPCSTSIVLQFMLKRCKSCMSGNPNNADSV